MPICGWPFQLNYRDEQRQFGMIVVLYTLRILEGTETLVEYVYVLKSMYLPCLGVLSHSYHYIHGY